MHFALFTMLILHHIHIPHAITNFTVNLEMRTVPRDGRSFHVGYNGAGTILLVGGRPDAQQLMTFSTQYKSFNTESTSYLTYAQNVYSYSQTYFDTGDGSLWILGGQEVILHFDTITRTMDATVATVPDSFNWFGYYACLAKVGNLLFVLGGIDTSDVTTGGIKTGKIYNFVSEEWFAAPLFNELRSRFSCVVTPNDELYAIAGGGIDMHSMSKRFTNYFSSIEKLNVSYGNLGNVLTQTAEWQMIPNSLRQPVAAARAVLYLDEIIVIGGFNGVTEVSDISCINYNTDDVRLCGLLQVPLLDVAPIVVDRTLHIFGGSYDTTTSGWKYSNYYQTIALPLSSEPTSSPSSQPTPAPSTVAPSDSPSSPPTLQPSSAPSLDPTHSPSANPSQMPSVSPSNIPSSSPTLSPSSDPTSFPSVAPTKVPSSTPTSDPSEPPLETTEEEEEKEELGASEDMTDNLINLGFMGIVLWALVLVFCWWRQKKRKAKKKETDALAEHVEDHKDENADVSEVDLAQVDAVVEAGGEESGSEPAEDEGANVEATGNETTKGDANVVDVAEV